MLVGAAVGVVAVTVVIIIALRRRKRKKVVLHAPAIAMSNLVYGGNTSKLQVYTQSAIYYFLYLYAVTDIDGDSIAKEKYASGVLNSHFTTDDTYDVPTWGPVVYEAIGAESPYEMV